MDKQKLRDYFKLTLLILLISVVGAVTIYGLFYGGAAILAWIMESHYERVARNVIDPKAAAYIFEEYPGNDFDVGAAYMLFKDNCYRVEVQSRSSQDTRFNVDFHHKTHEVERDSFGKDVTEKENTFARLEKTYNSLVQDSLEPVEYLHYKSGKFRRYSETTSQSSYFSPEGLDRSTLTLDQPYDSALGENYGYLQFTAVLPEDPIDIHSALKVLTEIDQTLAEDGVRYCMVDIKLIDAEYPETTESFRLWDIRREDLLCEDPLARLTELWEEQQSSK